MSLPLRVLFLEDQPSDVELMLIELRNAGFDPDWKRVENQEDYLAQLHQSYDIILADYSLPQFNVAYALDLLRECQLDIPFIVVTGAVGEEVAVECIKQGAADYLLKDRLVRLGQAVTRALEQKRLQDEKQQSEAFLRASEERYRLVSELISDYAYSYRVEPDGTFIHEWLTGSFTLITGFTSEEIDARGSYALYHPEDVKTAKRHTEEVLEGRSNSGEYRIITKDGNIRWVRIHRRPEWDAQEKRVVRFYGVAQDITDRKHAEEAEREQRTLAEALRDTAAALTSTLDPQLVMASILENADRVVPHDAANIMLIEDNTAAVAISRGYGEAMQEFLDTYRFPLDIPLYRRITANRAGYLIPDTTTDADWTSVPETSWIRSAIAVPIRIQDEIIGILNLDSATPHAFTPAHLERLQAFADQAAIAIKNARLLETEHKHNLQLEALRQASLRLTSTLDLQEVLEAILDHAAQLIAAEDMHIFLYNGKQLTFGAARWEGIIQSQSLHQPRPGGITYNVAHSGQKIVISSVNEHDLYQDWQWGGSLISLPLRVGRRVNGVMNLAFDQPRVFGTDEVRILELFADQAAIAIENAQLYERILRQSEELERNVADRTSQLRRSKERIETIFNHSSDAIILAHSDGIIQQNNGAFNELFGYQIDETFGYLLTVLVHPDHIVQFTQAINAVVNSSQRQRIEVVMCRKDGTTFAADLALSLISQSNYTVSDIVCTVRDITVRKQTEEALRLREREFKALAEHAPDIITRFNGEMRHLYVNPAVEFATGLPPEMFVGKTHLEVNTPLNIAQMWEEALRKVFSTGQETMIEFEYPTPSGLRYYQSRLVPEFINSDSVETVLTIARDITERKQAEERQKALVEGLRSVVSVASELIASPNVEAFYRQAVEVAKEKLSLERCAIYVEEGGFLRGTYGIDRHGQIVDEHNNQFPTTSVLWGERLRLVYPQEARWISHVQSLLEWNGEKTVSIGKEGWNVMTPIPAGKGFAGMFFNDAGLTDIPLDEVKQEVVAVYCSLLGNILERKRAEEALAQLAAIVESSNDAIIGGTLEGVITSWNPGAEMMYGYARDEMIGQTIQTVVPPERQDEITHILAQIRQGEHIDHLETVGASKDGKRIAISLTASPIRDATGKINGISTIAHDISQRIDAEEQIVRLNRDLERWAIELENALQKEKELNELKSRFSSMVSHEFRTPLATILSSNDLIKNFHSRMTDERRNEHLNTIHMSVQHLTEMLDDILLISKGDNVGLDFHPVPINLEAFCKAIADQIQLTTTAHEIVLSTEGECANVIADEKLLRRIVSNLLTNAIKYSPQGGEIGLELRCDAHNVTIRVKDEGIGIPDEDQQRLFETFHRARNVGAISGTGLGLAIVKHAIEAHGGTIHFDSHVGVGTAFTVQWPLRGQGLSEQPSATQSSSS